MADNTERSEKSSAGGTASFVERLVTDPAKPPQALLLCGFTGASSEAEHTRLYFDAELSDYVEIPDAAILYKQAMPVAQSPLGGSYVWVQRDAELVHGPVSVNRRKASFLEGRLRQDLAAAQPRIPPDTAPIVCADPTEIPPRCHPTVPAAACHTTASAGCHTIPGVNCPVQTSAAAGCHTIPGVNCPPVTSAAAGCHTIPGVNCPNPSAACPTRVHCPTEVSPHCPTNIIPCQTKPAQGCGETSAHFPCFATPAAPLPPTHLAPCLITVPAQVCATHPPQCLPPPTAHVTACPVISVCAVCPPTHTTPACGHSHLVVCPPLTVLTCPTLVAAHCPTHTPALCPPITGTPGCGVSFAGCQSIACNPQTIPGNPGFPGMLGGFPG